MHSFTQGIKRLWWIFVIVMPLTGFGMWLAFSAANDHANARIEQKFNQALRISDDKHRQALHAQSVLFAYSINKSTCNLRTIAQQQIMRLETTKTKGYKQAEVFWRGILDNQIPIPAGFDCASLPKKPPKATPEP